MVIKFCLHVHEELIPNALDEEVLISCQIAECAVSDWFGSLRAVDKDDPQSRHWNPRLFSAAECCRRFNVSFIICMPCNILCVQSYALSTCTFGSENIISRPYPLPTGWLNMMAMNQQKMWVYQPVFPRNSFFQYTGPHVSPPTLVFHCSDGQRTRGYKMEFPTTFVWSKVKFTSLPRCYCTCYWLSAPFVSPDH